MVICLERDADLHMAQMMPLPLTVSCFSKIQIGFTFLVPTHPGSPGQRVVKRVCLCVCATFSSGSEERGVTWCRRGRGGGCGVAIIAQFIVQVVASALTTAPRPAPRQPALTSAVHQQRPRIVGHLCTHNQRTVGGVA